MSNGSIIGNMATRDGGGVYVGGVYVSDDTFNMTGGNISSNKADRSGGGVYVNNRGTFTMSNGSIIGNISSNKANNSGGGVYVDGGTFNVSGAPKITGNTGAGDKNNNVCLRSGIKITVTGALTDGAKIGVYNTGEVATDYTYNGSDKPSEYFIPDNAANSCVSVKNGTVSVGTHTVVIDNAVAPTCTATGKTEGKHCSACNTVLVAQQIVAAKGHTEVTDNAVAPTCTAKGKTEGKHCYVCTMVITVQTEVAVLGHDYATEFTVDKQPTVSEKGSKSKHCSRCEEKTEITEIDMLKAELVKPDENGGEVDEVVVSIPSGFTPDIELVVTEIKEDNYAPQYEVIAESANGVIELVYDVTLKSDGVTVQPDGMLTIKLRIPENLKGKEFKLFHLHENTATDMEYTIDGHYVVVNVDELSEFIFVGEKALPKLDKGDSSTVWLVLIIIMAILILCEIGYVVLRKTGKIKFEGGK